MCIYPMHANAIFMNFKSKKLNTRARRDVSKRFHAPRGTLTRSCGVGSILLHWPLMHEHTDRFECNYYKITFVGLVIDPSL